MVGDQKMSNEIISRKYDGIWSETEIINKEKNKHYLDIGATFDAGEKEDEHDIILNVEIRLHFKDSDCYEVIPLWFEISWYNTCKYGYFGGELYKNCKVESIEDAMIDSIRFITKVLSKCKWS